MSPWLWMLLGVALSGLMIWGILWLCHRWVTTFQDEIGQEFQSLADALQGVTVRLDVIQREMQEALSEQAALHPLTGTAFLPTDADSAAMEKMIAQSEDRAIRAGGGVPSVRRVRTSGERLQTASLTRRASSSGRPS